MGIYSLRKSSQDLPADGLDGMESLRADSKTLIYTENAVFSWNVARPGTNCYKQQTWSFGSRTLPPFKAS